MVPAGVGAKSAPHQRRSGKEAPEGAPSPEIGSAGSVNEHSELQPDPESVCGGPGSSSARANPGSSPGNRASRPSRLEDCGYPTGKVDSPRLGTSRREAITTFVRVSVGPVS